MYVYVSFFWLLRAVAVAVMDCGGGGRGGRRQTETVTTDSPAQCPSGLLKLNSFNQAQRMFGGIGNVLLSTYSQTENGEDPLVSSVNL